MSTDLEQTPSTNGSAIVAHQARTDWTRKEIELVKQTVAKDTSDAELELFLKVAQMRQLDPFSGQIHAVMRYDSREQRKVMTIQVGLHGQRAIASRTGLHDWTEGPEFTADGQTWTDTWLDDAPPAAARCRVKRRDQSKAHQRTALWSEYAQTDRDGNLTHMWRDLGVTMLGKVAEVHALRAAFPDELGQFYAPEEMDQATTPASAAASDDDGEQDEPPVDHREERLELHRQFMAWWNELDEETQRKVWNESLKGRFWGDGPWGKWFAATPLHVLQELVDTLVGADGEVVEEGNDQDPDDGTGGTPAPDPDPEPEPDGDAGEVEPDPEAPDDEAEEEPEPPAATEDEPADPDHPGGATVVEALEHYYPHLSVADVGALLRHGEVVVDTGGDRTVTLRLPRQATGGVLAGFELVERLEQQHHDPMRQTVRGALGSAGWDDDARQRLADARAEGLQDEDAPADDETGPPRGEDGGASTTGPKGGATPQEATEEPDGIAARRRFHARYKRTMRELDELAPARARKVRTEQANRELADDDAWLAVPIQSIATLVANAERVLAAARRS